MVHSAMQMSSLSLNRPVSVRDTAYREALLNALDDLLVEHDDARFRRDTARQAEILENIRSVCSHLDRWRLMAH